MHTATGRPAHDVLSTLRNRAWAEVVLRQSRRPASKISILYPPTSSGQFSTIFAKTLELGRPTPRLWMDDGKEGPAILVEREYPGTLVWLIHPIWSTLASTDLPHTRTVCSTALSLSHPARAAVLKFPNDEGDLLLNRLEHLRSLGSLDSLTALVLLAQVMYLNCSPDGYEELQLFTHEHVNDWSCLNVLSGDLRQEFGRYVLTRLACCVPDGLPDAEEARLEVLERSLLMLDQPIPGQDRLSTISEFLKASQ